MVLRNPSLVVLALFISLCSGYSQYASLFAPQPRLFFNFFQQFDNQLCITSNAQFGRCMSRRNCVSTGGTSRGICNFGFKTCCQAATTTTSRPTTPTTASPTTASPTTASPTTASPTTASPTTASPTTASPTTASPTTASPTTASPTTASPTTASPTTASPTTASPTTASPTTASPTTPPTTPPMRSNDTLEKTSDLQTSDALSIRRLSTDYCQLKIEFVRFRNIGEVDRQGRCVSGQWTASGQNETNVPPICGENSGRHLYLTYDDAGNPINIIVVTSLSNSDWKIKATQIPCNNQAPPGCLQYFPESSGTVTSFNYRPINVMGNNVTYQPSNHNYTVCIGSSNSTSTKITWTRDPSSDLSFSISGISAIADPPNLGGIRGASFDDDCILDFIGINNGTFTNATEQSQEASKFCGIGFPVNVVSERKPFKLQVYTNAAEIAFPQADLGNVGFSLNYVLS